MTRLRNLILFSLLISCGSFAGEPSPVPSASAPGTVPTLATPAGPASDAAPPSRRSALRSRRTTAFPVSEKAAVTEPRTALAPVPGPSASRTVAYKETDVVPIATRIRFSTLILLPKTERILDFVTGDKDFWSISGSENVAYVKPAKEHSQTNLNLVTASGNVYSFVLSEVSGHPETQPDLKVFIETADAKMAEAASGPPRFVAATEIDDYRQQVQIAKEETRDARQAAQTAIERSVEKFRAGYAPKLKFVYRFERDKKPFQVTAMYHDDKFTYIQASPQETPVVYELKDGKPNLINFDYRDGTYVIAKILDSGYLSVGKSKLEFKREE